MLPPAPPTFSMITGWPRIGRIFSAMMRAVTSVEPPGGNGTISVIWRDGKVCACAPPAIAAASATTAISCFMLAPLSDGPSICGGSLRLDAGGLDDRPPLLDLGLLEFAERLRRR